jgi:nucleotide-binding universal stress UspA family protein
MLDIRRILLPVDYHLASLDVVREAAMLARRFSSEIVMLHVANMQSRVAGVPEDSEEVKRWDLLTAVIRHAKEHQDPTFGSEMDGLIVQTRLKSGDVATDIVQTAHEEKADLIMMPSHSFTFYQFLMGSVTAKVLEGTECPVWTGAHREGASGKQFAIRSILCSVDFNSRAEVTLKWAAELATAFGARLTLANVTPSAELWGPGGGYVYEKLKDELITSASQQMSKLLKDTGVTAEVLIGSGDVPTTLNQAVKKTGADLLVNGCYPYGGHLRTHGYAIICAVPIPVLSV